MEAGSIDIVVGLRPPSERLYSHVLYSDHFGVFCKKDSPLLHTKGRVPISYVTKAFDHLSADIDQFLTGFQNEFELRYSVESFTTVRTLVIEGVCAGVLPVQMIKKLLKDGSLVPFFAKDKFEYFGEYQVCATCAHDLKNEPRVSKIIKVMKAAANVGG